MKQYGADKFRSYDTLPTIKSARAFEGRVADEEIAEGIAELQEACGSDPDVLMTATCYPDEIEAGTAMAWCECGLVRPAYVGHAGAQLPITREGSREGSK